MFAIRRLVVGLATAALVGSGVLVVTNQLNKGEPVAPVPAPTPLPPAQAESTPIRGQLSAKFRMRSVKIAGRNFNYCSNGSIESIPVNVDRVIFVVHGNDRNACATGEAVHRAGTAQHHDRTLIVAPRFSTVSDPINPVTDWAWTPSSWSQGDTPIGSETQQASSFEVMNNLVDRAAGYERVVVGFSGGGQFVNRYSAMTDRQVHRFVVINPSSYLYFTPERPGLSPAALTACPAYNDYRYGVHKLPPNLGQTPERLKARYRRAPMTYLLGDADNNPRDGSMDKTCGANAQGNQRFERGRRYWDYLPTVFGPEIRQNQSMFIVPKVGHNLLEMVTSPAGQRALYG